MYVVHITRPDRRGFFIFNEEGGEVWWESEDEPEPGDSQIIDEKGVRYLTRQLPPDILAELLALTADARRRYNH